MLAIIISKPPIIIIIIIAAADHNHHDNHNPGGGQKGRTVSIYWINPNSITSEASYMRKLLRLYYIGSRKYVIENRNLPNQTLNLKRYTRTLNNSSNQIWEYQRVSSKSDVGKLEIRCREFEKRTFEQRNLKAGNF